MDHVNLFLYDGAIVPDPQGISPAGKTTRPREPSPSGRARRSTRVMRRGSNLTSVRFRIVETLVRNGGCLCEAVRYRVRGEPVHVGRCHCADCRKESGSAFTVYAQWPIEAFEVTGDVAAYHGRGFCPRCGARLFNPPEPGDRLVEIRLGTLDDAPFDLPPQAEIWVKRRETWIPPVEGASQHVENRHGAPLDGRTDSVD